MPDIHRIRLRDPWTAEPLADGRTRSARRFGRPTNLGTARVWLVLPGPAEVWLNGERLGDASDFDVTGRLAERNTLEVRTVGPLSEAVIEVRE
ncbi:MAG TPA: hypothetical protein VM597_33210 [Gemmataceae bacterium]|nr:hypothetical protein [Gemmataceae bacterium]